MADGAMRHSETNKRGLRLALALTLAVAAGAAPAAAQTGGGDVQLLWGADFHDALLGNATADGAMGTLTLEHFGPWALGDQYFFIDIMAGTFDEAVGRSYRTYAEWTPRLSLSKAAGRPLTAGPISDVLVVGEVQAGSGGYAAALIGPGVDLAVPGFAVLQASVLYRNDSFDPGTWQATGVWIVPVRLGPEWTLAGFVDVIGQPGEGGARVFAQPQLLLDLGSLAGAERRDLQIGIEWYLHYDGADWHSVPQALLRWAW